MLFAILFTILAMSSGWSKPTILISYFDAFDGSMINNSSVVTQNLALRLKNHPQLEIQLCPLNTVFDKSYDQLQDCIHQLPQPELMILGLGEALCEMKVETMARNKDKSYGPDNEGNERHGPIITGANEHIGLRYPLHEMYCALNPEERREIIVSNDAGSFVCNNLIFKMNYYHPQHQFGFIHVPAHNCENLEQKNKATIEKLEKMLIKIVDVSTRPSYPINLPHWENQFRLPVEKHEIKVIREQSPNGTCLQEFTSKLKSPDVWNWFRNSKHHN